MFYIIFDIFICIFSHFRFFFSVMLIWRRQLAIPAEHRSEHAGKPKFYYENGGLGQFLLYKWGGFDIKMVVFDVKIGFFDVFDIKFDFLCKIQNCDFFGCKSEISYFFKISLFFEWRHFLFFDFPLFFIDEIALFFRVFFFFFAL
jgi:hypothetical protein